jgi:hypothetical protein
MSLIGLRSCEENWYLEPYWQSQSNLLIAFTYRSYINYNNLSAPTAVASGKQTLIMQTLQEIKGM